MGQQSLQYPTVWGVFFMHPITADTEQDGGGQGLRSGTLADRSQRPRFKRLKGKRDGSYLLILGYKKKIVFFSSAGRCAGAGIRSSWGLLRPKDQYLAYLVPTLQGHSPPAGVISSIEAAAKLMRLLVISLPLGRRAKVPATGGNLHFVMVRNRMRQGAPDVMNRCKSALARSNTNDATASRFARSSSSLDVFRSNSEKF